MNPVVMILGALGVGGAAWFFLRNGNGAAFDPRNAPGWTPTPNPNVYYNPETGEYALTPEQQRIVGPGVTVDRVTASGRAHLSNRRILLGPDETMEDVWRDATPHILETGELLRDVGETAAGVVPVPEQVGETAERIADTEAGRAARRLFGAFGG